MPNIYFTNNEASELVNSVIEKWYPILVKAKVKIGVLMTMSGNENTPAIKENGYPAEGTIKIVSLKDRVIKNYDAEMIIDASQWADSRLPHKEALIDHLLARIDVKTIKQKKKRPGSAETEEDTNSEFATDDINRPILKLKRGDWTGGIGFKDVVVRHGEFSIEHRTMERALGMMDNAMDERLNNFKNQERSNQTYRSNAEDQPTNAENGIENEN